MSGAFNDINIVGMRNNKFICLYSVSFSFLFNTNWDAHILAKKAQSKGCTLTFKHKLTDLTKSLGTDILVDTTTRNYAFYDTKVEWGTTLPISILTTCWYCLNWRLRRQINWRFSCNIFEKGHQVWSLQKNFAQPNFGDIQH